MTDTESILSKNRHTTSGTSSSDLSILADTTVIDQLIMTIKDELNGDTKE